MRPRVVWPVRARPTIGGLQPGTSYDVLLSGSGWPRQRVATLTTLGPPLGRLLSRFATIGDCHIGEPSVGALRRYRDPDPRPPDLPPYAERCARAAITEAEAWGAELLVAKGDLTYEGEVEEFEEAARVLGGASVPVEAILAITTSASRPQPPISSPPAVCSRPCAPGPGTSRGCGCCSATARWRTATPALSPPPTPATWPG